MPEKKFIYKDCSKCSRKCNVNFTENDVRIIFQKFWAMKDSNKQRQYLAPLIKEIPKERVRAGSNESRRKITRNYFFYKNNKEIQVCLGFFLSTLNVSETFVRNILKKRDESNTVVSPDKRGRHCPSVKRPDDSREIIRNHINSFPSVPSHYCCQASSRQYLANDLNVNIMYELYAEQCKERGVNPEKLWLYRDIFNNELNLAFHKPRKDECDQCHRYRNLPDDQQELEKTCYDEHIRHKQFARELKNKYKEEALQDKCHLLEFDLEAVKILPSVSTKNFFLQTQVSRL